MSKIFSVETRKYVEVLDSVVKVRSGVCKLKKL
jgi:hypothetical protein